MHQQQTALAGDLARYQADVAQYNADAAALNAEDGPIAADNAALTADILKHNAPAPLFNFWPFKIAYNAEGAALATRQAALNARILAHDAKKAALDARAASIRARETDINARLAQNAAALAQRARELPAFEQPTQFNGLTEHGEAQVNTRDGHGVADAALHDAVANPVRPPKYIPDSYGGVYRYVGRDATVNLNEAGGAVTAWAKTRNGWRTP